MGSIFFYSNENNEPVHVHIAKGKAYGKVWLEPGIEVVYLEGFTRGEERIIMEIIQLHVEDFKSKWNEYFSK